VAYRVLSSTLPVAPVSSGATRVVLARTGGYVKVYSPEYRDVGADAAALSRLAWLGGGRFLGPATRETAQQVYLRERVPVRTRTRTWPWLIAAAVCLFPFDVAVRRLAVDRDMLCGAVGWLWRKRPRARELRQAPAPLWMARLLSVKGRGADGSSVRVMGQEEAPRSVPTIAAGDEIGPSGRTEARGAETGRPLETSRLLAAKRRTREGKERSGM